MHNPALDFRRFSDSFMDQKHFAIFKIDFFDNNPGEAEGVMMKIKIEEQKKNRCASIRTMMFYRSNFWWKVILYKQVIGHAMTTAQPSNDRNKF